VSLIFKDAKSISKFYNSAQKIAFLRRMRTKTLLQLTQQSTLMMMKHQAMRAIQAPLPTPLVKPNGYSGRQNSHRYQNFTTSSSHATKVTYKPKLRNNSVHFIRYLVGDIRYPSTEWSTKRCSSFSSFSCPS
jgi:hypothetical protein